MLAVVVCAAVAENGCVATSDNSKNVDGGNDNDMNDNKLTTSTSKVDRAALNITCNNNSSNNNGKKGDGGGGAVCVCVCVYASGLYTPRYAVLSFRQYVCIYVI